MFVLSKRITAAALVAAAGGAALLAGGSPAPAGAGTPLKKVKMFDNYYSPAKLTVRPGTRVQWVWPSDVGDSHDVKLKKAPSGVKRFQSPPFAAEAKWPQPARTFKKPGTYKLFCSFHETEMTMTIVVKKAS
jgi:plastocyanin